ncbi:gibberellin 2-oxidase 8 [Actinidia rufa]|uniref:Gibberellin 2-oxidase 8 n=1 Tax=Actinidia rufa TaxID=165716 RepID=A0A7J0GNT6_9ERIC|nr:gibberellin 2-oxidase 8 [Actinidia rufa]
MESDPPFQEKYKSLFGSVMEQMTTTEKSARERLLGLPAKLGLFQVVNHGISGEILARMKCEQQKLFWQPFQKKVKEKFLDTSTDYYHWGNPNATSLMQFSWSEAFHIPLNHVQMWKEYNSTLSTTVAEFAEMVSELAQKIAEILAENFLGYKSNYFARNCQPSSCYLRMSRYPPCPISSDSICGLVPHTDSDFLTILYQDQVGGLQMLKDGKWVGIKPNPQALIINVGDLFQAWSNGAYKSIEHRVVTNHEVERFSVGYFLCPSSDTFIQCCGEPALYRKFSFREYRQQVQEDVKSTGNKVGLPRFLM